ncbi:MAG: DUF3575 domain-containing protein [Flavobacteriaceae bacterium]
MKIVNKPILILFLFSFVGLIHAQTEVKFNAASAVLLIPNVGVELPLSKHRSLQLDVLGSFWDKAPFLNDTPLHLTQVFLEHRWYSGAQTQKWFVAPHIGFGMFTLQKPRFLVLYDHYVEINGGQSSGGLPEGDNYQSGRIAFYGVTLGYKKRFSNVWAVELFAGLGLSQSKYRGYQNIDNQYVSSDINFNGSGEVLLYRGGVMISYTFGQQSNKNTDGL